MRFDDGDGVEEWHFDFGCGCCFALAGALHGHDLYDCWFGNQQHPHPYPMLAVMQLSLCCETVSFEECDLESVRLKGIWTVN